MTKQNLQKGFELALQAQNRAYAPYSRFHVGAAVQFRGSEHIQSGCNIENASYGATVCAERVAIWSYRAQNESAKEIESLWLVTSGRFPPCGMCLQVISEFATEKTQIHFCDDQGVYETVFFPELLPRHFKLELPLD